MDRRRRNVGCDIDNGMADCNERCGYKEQTGTAVDADGTGGVGSRYADVGRN